ncbi:MAG: hypothetical protein L6R35_002260 [Caloplaca aegaea]|nr:MAG: hypothetical protein L6R35_002260 [Caloplaca aegaea]
MALQVQSMPSPHALAPFCSNVDDLSTNKCGLQQDPSSAARQWLEAEQFECNDQQQVGAGRSFFDFEPQLESGTHYPPHFASLADTDLTPGWSAIAAQIPSPPDSATSPSSSWPPFPLQQQRPVHNILTDIYPDTRVHAGQNTPPDDDAPNLFTLADQLPQDPIHAVTQVVPANTRKQKPESAGPNTSTIKRSRKYGRSANSQKGGPTSSAEEVRRHKFLERNRVAASKCRQKKKEWTQNLESRARELQKENRSVRIMLDSLRDEMLFLKGEMLKHSNCSCEHIQGWVKSSAASRDLSPIIKSEQSPVNSAPTTRRGSVSSFTSPEKDAPRRRSKSPGTRKLEGLLLDNLVHDTSDKGIAATTTTTTVQ